MTGVLRTQQRSGMPAQGASRRWDGTAGTSSKVDPAPVRLRVLTCLMLAGGLRLRVPAGKLDEDVVRTTAEALVKSGLAAKGYRYGTLAAALRTLNP